MTRRLLKYIGWGFITAAGYRVTRGYNETRPPVCLKVNSVSFIDFFRSDFVQESRFKGFLPTIVAKGQQISKAIVGIINSSKI